MTDSPVPAREHHTPAWLAGKPWWFDLLCVVAGALIAHAGMLAGGFIYDDTLVCFAEVVTRGDGVFAIFSPTDYYRIGAGEASWRPVATLTHWLDFQIFNGRVPGPPFNDASPLGPRLVNWLLHAGAAAMVWQVAGRWRFPRVAALVAGLLFAVHPLTGESVAIISFREEMLTVLGFGATIWLATTPRPTAGRLAAAGVAAFLTCGAKELGFVLPVLLAAAAWLVPALPEEPGDEPRGRRVLRWAGPAAAGAAVFAVLRFGVFVPPADFDMGYVGHPGGGGLTTGLTMMQVMARYAWWFCWPLPLSVDHTPAIVESLGDWRAWTGLGAMLGMLAFGVRAWRRSPMVALGWTWVVLGLAPVLDILPLANIIAERYCYLPLAGAGLMVGWGVQRWIDRRHAAGAGSALVVAVAAAATCFSFGRHWVRTPDWEHDAPLWEAVAKANPDSFRAMAMHGYVLSHVQLNRQELTHALARITRTEAAIGRPLRRGPEYAAARDTLAQLLERANFDDPSDRFRVDMARKKLEIQVRLESLNTAPRWSPEEATNWLNLGIAYHEAGAIATEARRPLKNRLETYATLMKDRQRDGLDSEPIRQQISRVVDLMTALPDPQPYLEEAERWMLKSVATDRMPRFMRAAAYENLSATAGLMEQKSERARRYAEQALELQPTRVYAHYNLGVYWGEKARLAGPTPEAEEYNQRAIDHYRACLDDPRTMRLAFLNYVSAVLKTPALEDARGPAAKALMDEWAAMCDKLPHDLEFRKQLAVRCLMTKLNERARVQHERCLAQDPSWAEGWFNLAALVEEGMGASYEAATESDPEAALRVVEEGYRQAGPERMDAVYDGRKTLERLRARVRQKQLEAELKESPGDVAKQIELAQTFVALNMGLQALKRLQIVQDLDPAAYERAGFRAVRTRLEAQQREMEESRRLEKEGTVAAFIEAARGRLAHAEIPHAQAWLKRAQELNPDEYEKLGGKALHTRVQQAIDIASANERTAHELAERAMQAAKQGQWPFAVYLWRTAKQRDVTAFRRLGGPARLADAEARLEAERR